jgi:hypothetical protein
MKWKEYGNGCGLLVVKVKVNPEQAVKAQRGSGGIALLFL